MSNNEQEIKIKTDCEFYKNNRHCNALKQMYCNKEICSFYQPKQETTHNPDKLDKQKQK